MVYTTPFSVYCAASELSLSQRIRMPENIRRATTSIEAPPITFLLIDISIRFRIAIYEYKCIQSAEYIFRIFAWFEYSDISDDHAKP